MRLSRRGLLLLALVACASTLVAGSSSQQDSSDNDRDLWPNWGNGLSNNHFAKEERRISARTIKDLAPKWALHVGADVSGVPTVAGDRVYFPDWHGFVWCVDADDGSVKWKVRLDNYTGIYGAVDPRTGMYSGSHSRNSPAVAYGLIFLGDLASGNMMALDATTGALVWKRLLDPHIYAIITQSATVYKGRVYVGVSSEENTMSAVPTYPCCTFRGSMYALDAYTGDVVWRTYTAPANYTGAPVWGSSPSIDPALGLVYIGTGNNYKQTPDVAHCKAHNISIGNCPLNPENRVDSIIALRMATGAVAWSKSFAPGRTDAFNLGCTPQYLGYPPSPNANCPEDVGADADFAQAPMLIEFRDSRNKRVRAVGAGQKNGKFVLLDRATGDLLWAVQAGPGGLQGGAQWGSAFDGERIYVAIVNSLYQPYNLTNTPCNLVKRTYGGVWTALEPATGAIVWQTPVPEGIYSSAEAQAMLARAYSPLTVANGLVFAGTDTRGGPNYFALDAASGAIVWTFSPGGSVAAAPAIVDGVAYWGCGYGRNSLQCDTFYALAPA